MPACPDCGLMFDSLHNVQIHRRSGACSMQSLGAPAASPVQQPMVCAAGCPVTPPTSVLGHVSSIGSGGYSHGKGGFGMQSTPVLPAATARVPCMSPIEREIEQALAIQRNQQTADMAERERMLLEQQVNLVLPARQAQLQQSQQALKDQLLQMKLQLFSNQQQQQSSSNMDMEYLRNEIAAMRGALSSMGMNCTSNSDPGLPWRKPHKPQHRKATSARTRNVRRRRQHGCHIDEDDSWGSLDGVLCSDEYGDDRGEACDRDSSSRSPSPRNARLFSPTPSQKIHSALKSMQAEIRSLRAMSATRMEPAFPTASMLEPGLHLLKLAALEGIALAVPLDEVDVSIKVYYMSHVHNEYLLEPYLERSYPRRPPSLVRHDANTMLFTIPPLEFIVHSPKEMVVFVLQVFYRGRLLCWAAIFAKSTGSFSEGIRNSCYDLAKALQTPGGMIPEASVSGYIETDSLDVLQHAESILNPSAVSFSACPGSPFPQRQHVQLPGLPPLPPPPLGQPLLPGMPGCEGPFLPPTSDGHMMLLQPTKGPVAHFILPPRAGVSILEWNQEVVKHLKKIQKHLPSKATAPAAEKGAANGKHGSNWKPPASPPSQRQVMLDSSSSDSSVQSFSPLSSMCISQPTSNGSPLRDPPLPIHGQAEIIGEDMSKHPPVTRQQQQRRSHRSAVYFTKGISEAVTAAEVPAAKSPTMSIRKPQEPAKVSAVAALAKEPLSTYVPSSQTHTPPPSTNASLAKLEAKEVAAEKLPDNPKSPMASTLSPCVPSADNQAAPLQAATPPPAPCKVPREDMPLVERSRLRVLMDPQGNLAVPPNYKLNPNNPPCVNLHKLHATADPPVNPCVLLGLSKPTDRPPATLTMPGHGENGSTVDIFVDGVSGVPLDAVCSRVLVYITDELDLNTGGHLHPLHHPRVYMRKPNLVAYQNLTSSSIEPVFEAKMSSNVGDQTHAVVIVEYINGRQESPIVLGHCCLPISKRFFAGNFVARLKVGDPRRSQERAVDEMRSPSRISDEQKRATEKYNQSQLEASVDSQALRNLMPLPPSKLSECAPLGYLIWRLESPDMRSPFFEMPQQVPLSQQEVQLFEDRKNHADVTPNSKGLTSEKAADEAFIGSGTTQTDSISFIAPFSEQRGAFVKVEGIRGVGDDAAMYVVVVYMAKAPKGRRVYYTTMPDWASDVGAPMFKDPPFAFQGIQYDKTNTTTYMLLKLSRLENAANPPLVECIGWTMNKLFIDSAPALRQGRYVLPWLNGPLPPVVVQELLTQQIGTVFLSRMNAKTIAYLEPKATLTISQGDPACCMALVDNTPGRAQPRQLLVSAAIKKAFPSCTCEGMVGCTLGRAHEKCFGGGDARALLQRMNMAVQEYLTAKMKELEEL
ncbi:hypothetical protein, conserved [Leishmania donovani]|uniref:Uncharacterized protein n=1 Tax=Leishmania donovani TaxID=5661 RepID=A0A3S7WZU4_LEIDO|nr:hypothetical protein, conserved [Leishmania donovani]AYU79744.1 hypothetical protein LdCL_260019900 [Leishmania donovani]TPP41179.1 hypothetical protein CGC21_32050 [Leishmania donovani]CBZ35031.1 hypothetical protein, conserved [Leishmania donovani]